MGLRLLVAIAFILILLTPGMPTSIPSFTRQSSATTILFNDTYTNSAWHQVGGFITVNSLTHPGVVYFNNVAGGGTVDDNRIVKRLPTTLPIGSWTADFDYKFTASSIPDMHPFVFTATTANPQLQTDLIEVRHGPGVDQLSIVAKNSPSSSPIPISANTQYYVRLQKTPTQLELFVFSDPARTIQIPGSPVTDAISSTDFGDLNFLQHDGCLQCGTARYLDAQVANTLIYTP